MIHAQAKIEAFSLERVYERVAMKSACIVPALAAIAAFASSASADSFLWNNAAGGAFESPENWSTFVFEKDGDGNLSISAESPAARCPGAGDSVYFGGGPYTVTFAGDHEVATLDNYSSTYWSRNGNPADQIVFDLGGHSLSVATRASVFTMYGDYSNLCFSNGTLNCSERLVRAGGGEQWNLGGTSGFGIGVTWGVNWSAGEPWSDWIPHIGMGLSGVEANLDSIYAQGSLATLRIDNGARVTVAKDVSFEKTGSTDFILAGEGTALGCRVFETSGHTATNIVEDGAVLTAQGIVNGWYGEWSDDLKQVAIIVRGGGRIVLTNHASNVTLPYMDGAADGGEGSVYYDVRASSNHRLVVEGEGSELRFDEAGDWRCPQFLLGSRQDSTNNFLVARDGALVHGSDSSSIVLGGAPGSFGHGVEIDDATVFVGHFLCGSEWANWDFGEGRMGQSSNAVLRVSGENALLEVRSYGASGNEANGCGGAMTLNYNAHLDIEIPPDGFARAPIQVPNNILFAKASEIPGYDTPACHLTLRALDWTRRHPATRQVLVSTGYDSTAAFQALIDNAVFPDVGGTAYMGELSIEDNGTKLVYRCPAAFGTLFMVE